MPGCTRCCAFKAIRDITSGMSIMAACEFLSQLRTCYYALTTKLSTPRAPSGAPYDD